MDAWRTPKLVLRAHLPDQRAQFHLNSRAPSPRVRCPTPIATKAGPMPPHQRFRLDNRNDRQDRWKPSIHLDEEPAVVVGKLGSTPHLAPQDGQLMTEHRILRLNNKLFEQGASTHNSDERARLSRPVQAASLATFRGGVLTDLLAGLAANSIGLAKSFFRTREFRRDGMSYPLRAHSICPDEVIPV